MAVVKSLTSENVTICATIHSPPPYTFQLFDRLLVLVRGETVYFGPNGDAMVSYFKACGVTPPHTMLSTGEIANNADYLTGAHAETLVAQHVREPGQACASRCILYLFHCKE